MKRTILLAVLAFVAIVLPSCTYEDIQRGTMATGALIEGLRPLTYAETQNMSLCVSARIAAMHPVYQDQALTRYVNMVAMTVGHYSDRPDFNYRVLLLDAPGEVNAFTTADARIFVTTGLLAAVQDESELAGVLGHEIAHASRGHVVKAIKNERTKQGIVNAAAIMLQDDGTFTAIANASFDAIALRPRDRQQESEADTYGTYYAEAAGYDPKGLENFLARLSNMEQGGGSAFTKIYDTHPDINQRVTDLSNSIETNFHPREYNHITVTGAGGAEIERSQYFTASLRHG
jgi:predicted Zn-dependent protease